MLTDAPLRPQPDADEESTPPANPRRDETASTFAWLTENPADPGAELARERIVVLNVPVAHAIAGRYRSRGVDLEDLQQVACVALVRAVRSFDSRLGNDFLTYAVPCIRGEVKRHFRDAGWMVRPPRRIQELQGRINAMSQDVLDWSGPRVPELAAATGSTEAEVSEALRAQGCFTPTSLDMTVGPDTDTTLGAMLTPADDQALAAAEARMVLAPLLARLGERDRHVLHLRYVIGLTQQEIGEELGVTQMTVSRRLTRIHRDLHAMLIRRPSPITSIVVARPRAARESGAGSARVARAS